MLFSKHRMTNTRTSLLVHIGLKFRMKLKEFIRKYGEPYSKMLGINLKSGSNNEVVKWFLASILYSKPIKEKTATETYRIFEEKGVITSKAVLDTGWEGLVSILDEGGYARYDFSTAEKLLVIFKKLQSDYDGDLNRLYDSSVDTRDLEQRLKNLGKGIGDTTISVFLRDTRIIWKKANPKPSPLVSLGMKKLKIRDLPRFAREHRVGLVRLETALLRLGKDYLRKGKTLKIDVDC